MINLSCTNCNSKNIIKKGLKENKFQVIQRYKCKNCEKYFTLQNSKNTTYPIAIIIKGISLYNLGYSLKEVSNLISKEKKINISTISLWVNKYKPLTSYNKLRKQAIKLYNPKEIIFKKQLRHKQVYLFKYHKAKLKILPRLNKNLPLRFIERLTKYLEKIQTDKFPHHIFNKEIKKEEQRSSKLKFKTLNFVKLSKNNYANKLAKIALKSAKNNYQRHQKIQDFMLANDTSTIATEIPVYLTKYDIKYFIERDFKLNLENQETPITGHIDILQLRNNLIHILDYKPDADKINPINQLTIYALALASRLQIPIKCFKAAWFDDKNYFEFFPLHAVYNKKINKTKNFNNILITRVLA